ncbi:MAG TPA: substrate-binding domain-containing protein [Tepidisphaeraceae bacterium]|jgi:DNA-binding LacI/PurR family transcriptional regulator|nr:substrate-binding domain-containing protein [Tepidisphaeraceae bacterium]
MLAIPDLGLEFPNRNAAKVLRDRIAAYIRTAQPPVGSRFLTDAEVVERSKLSRSTVRRALDELSRDGWIDRRIGDGTFVGPRAAYADVLRDATTAGREDRGGERQLVRLAVLIFAIGDLAHDWYTPPVLEGMDEAAEQHGVRVELLGNRDRDVDALSRRLSQSPPDVLACLSAEPKQAFVIRDAQKLGVKCLLAGTPHVSLGLPAVCEDNRHGMTLAVRHLVEHGHRRIGLVVQRQVERWTFDRHEAYFDAMRAAGLEVDESLVHWMPAATTPATANDAIAALRQYLRRARPTALVPTSFVPMFCVDQLVRAGELRVPEDVSVVSFEQRLPGTEWLSGLPVTTVQLPLRAMGRQLAHMARLAAEDRPVAGEAYLPCGLQVGGTVRSHIA